MPGLNARSRARACSIRRADRHALQANGLAPTAAPLGFRRHSPLLKSIFIVTNLVVAVALIVLGSVALAAHRTHAYSVYRELQSRIAEDSSKFETTAVRVGAVCAIYIRSHRLG